MAESRKKNIFSLSFFISFHAEFNTKLNGNRLHGTWNGVSNSMDLRIRDFGTIWMWISRPTKERGKRKMKEKECFWFLWQNYRRCSFWLRSWLTCFILHGFWVYFCYLVCINEAPFLCESLPSFYNNNTSKHIGNGMRAVWDKGRTGRKKKTRNKKLFLPFFFSGSMNLSPFSISFFFSYSSFFLNSKLFIFRSDDREQELIKWDSAIPNNDFEFVATFQPNTTNS